MSDIVLSAGVRQNLLSLQKTAAQMSTTATGLRAISPLVGNRPFVDDSMQQ